MGKESKLIGVLNDSFLMEGADYSSVLSEDTICEILNRPAVYNTLEKCLIRDVSEIPYIHNYIEDILNGKSAGYGSKFETLTYSIDYILNFGFSKIESYPFEFLSVHQILDYSMLNNNIREKFTHSNQKWLENMVVQLSKIGFSDFEHVDFEAYHSDFFLFASSMFCLLKDGNALNDLRKKLSKNYIPYDLNNSYKEVLQMTAIMGELLEVKYKDIFQKLLKGFVENKPELKTFDMEQHPSICSSNLASIINSLIKRAGLDEQVDKEMKKVRLSFNDKKYMDGKEIDKIGYLDCFKFYFAYQLRNKRSTDSLQRLYSNIYSKSDLDYDISSFKKLNNLISTIIGFEQSGGDFCKVLNLYQKYKKTYSPKIFMSKIEEIRDLIYLNASGADIESIADLFNAKGLPLHNIRNILLKTILVANELDSFDYNLFVKDIMAEEGDIDYLKLQEYEDKILKSYVKQKNYSL